MSLINPEQLAQLCRFAATMPAGDFVEVGVYRGGSAVRIAEVAREQGRVLWLFDTFTGTPCQSEFDIHHKVGAFADCSEADVRALIPEAKIVVGDCRKTLKKAKTGPVAFAHVDCDQYESIRACILGLGPRMVPGGVMWFDDYGAGLIGADRAIDELLGGRIERHECDKVYVRY